MYVACMTIAYFTEFNITLSLLNLVEYFFAQTSVRVADWRHCTSSPPRTSEPSVVTRLAECARAGPQESTPVLVSRLNIVPVQTEFLWIDGGIVIRL